MKTQSDKIRISESELQSRPEPLSTGSRLQIDFALRRKNQSLNTDRLLDLLRYEAPRFFAVAEVVGKWVWIEFAGKQPAQVTRLLAELGFHWNHARQCWQHPCGIPANARAPYDPRERYGSYFASETLVKI
jgi:hypothetical protein